MPKPSDKPIVFTKHADIHDMRIVGYESHLKAGIGMGRKAQETSDNYTVLLAGYPGTGKTVYPTVLAKKLPDCSLLYIKGNSLLRLDDTREIIRELNGLKPYLSETPLVIAFDELDLLAPSRIIRPLGYTVVTGAMMDILDERPEKTLTLVMANNPLNLDMAISSRLEYTLFFDLPEREDLGETLKGLEVPNPYEVANILYDKARRTNGRLVIRSLVRACNRVKERVDDPKEMANLLFPHAPQFDWQQIVEYEAIHRGFKERSGPAIDYWEKVAKVYEK